MNSTSVRRELKDRFRGYLLSLRCGSKQPRIRSKRSIRPVMTGLPVGVGLFEPLLRVLRCLTKKPIERFGDRGIGPPECDRAKPMLSVSTLGAVSWDNAACPSPPGASSDHPSMVSGALGPEAISMVS